MEKEIGREWRGEGEEVRKITAEKEEGVVKELADPRRPSGKEVEKHRRTHVPYRNWCDMREGKGEGLGPPERSREGKRLK